MTIEFFTPQGEVPEHIILFIKEKLMEFYHRDDDIYGAEVVLRNQRVNPGNDHICEITLSIYGEVLMVHRAADNFLQAAREVLEELSLRVDEFLLRQREPPDQILSTVRV
ncbi:MAG TPA: HPF/RaiA family ribosome-associated protein [Chitinophagaceae bacterium]|nr:HPF/RaiA family ribosome-associated protein [Chitinophagaceae bacterium]